MTNIIYITSECNLDCEYCYERDERESLTQHKIISFSEIDKLFKTNVSQSDCIVLFGGEPFIRYDRISYILKKYPNYNFNIVTNGIILSTNNEIYNDFITNYNKNNITLNISYDRSGQYRRNFKNGKSSKDIVETLLSKLEKDNFHYNIRYTIHNGNVKDDKYIDDFIYIFKKYKCVDKIVCSVFYNEIKVNIDNFNKKLTQKCKFIYDYFKKSICEFTCDSCRKCKKGTINKYSVSGYDTFEELKTSCEEFDHFTK